MSGYIYLIVELCVLYIVIMLSVAAFKYIYSYTNNKRVWESLHGKFCLVINANTDEGEALCLEVVERGFKLIMIGDNDEKLLSIKSKIKKRSKVCHHVVDFSNCLDYSFLEKYDIGLVINNLRFKDNKPKFFTDQRIERFIDFYFKGQLQMMNHIICSMMERNKGYIVNLAYSYNGHPNPHHALTSSILSAYRSWSESMYYELMPYNINVEFMDTGKLFLYDGGKKYPTLLCPIIQNFAKSVLNTLGSSYFTIPYFPHMIEYLFFMLLPGSWVGRYRSSRNIKFNRDH